MMKKNENREKVMEEVDKIRAKGVYSHTSDDCSDACKARGKSFDLSFRLALILSLFIVTI